MRILISNDDGMDAPGIRALIQVMSDQGEVTVVAPEGQRSASSHGISLHRSLRVERIDVPGTVEAYKTSGTPVDCVKWALATIHRDTPFDIVLSGINAGANLATDVLYSGTVAVAGEAALQGVKAIALSALGPPFDFDKAGQVARDVVQMLQPIPFPSDTFLSVNIPHDTSGEVAWTTLGVRTYRDEFSLELDAGGHRVYRYGGDIVEERGDGTLDVDVVANGMVSITPLRYRFTDHDFYAALRQAQENQQ